MIGWNPFRKPASRVYFDTDMSWEGFKQVQCFSKPRYAQANPKSMWPGEIEANIVVDYHVTSLLYTQPDTRANFVTIDAVMREVPI